ncbi:UPF0488 protein C8orf33 homolog [Aulostomus maculatus]
MSEQKLRFLDIKPKSNGSASVESRTAKPLRTRGNNNFRFNFFSEDSPAPQTESSTSDETEPSVGQVAITGQDSAFAFNFQIPPDSPEGDMTTEASDMTPPRGQHNHQDDNPSDRQGVSSVSEPPAPSKTKKKKKSGKKKATGGAEAQQEQNPVEGSAGGEDTELSPEEQLKRQLDWCIEQLELGMKSQKATTKQKEEASRALKTLSSSKAPLAKKRQVMRAVAGDYRKKMEEEKNKQFKLIQSELASAQVKTVSESPKKSVFHRRADVKTQTPASAGDLQPTQAQDKNLKSQTREENSAFVFTPSKEEFRFNFL